MKKTKKILALFLAVIMLMGVMPMTASAVTSGTCGDNLTWSFNESTGKLSITGTGAMYDYDYNNRPWESYEDSIKSVTIGDSVTTIGDGAFYYCDSLTSVTIGDSVTIIGDYAFSGCDSLASATIGDSVTTIGDGAFYSCGSLESVIIPDSVTTIGDYAFNSCYSLESVTIPDSVTTIGSYAFAYCHSLTSVTVDADNTAYSSDEYGVLFNKDKTQLIQYPIGNWRTSYTIPDSVTSIGYYAFSGCYSLESVTIPDSVTTIGNDAFSGCDSLASVTIPDSVTTIGNAAFLWCDSLASVTIPDSVTTIGNDAFSDCYSLVSVTIPDSVTTIGDGAFSGCDSLDSVTIGDSVTTIGGGAFAYCRSLTSVTIGDSVTTIGDYAFYSCDSLTDVYYSGTQAQWNAISIGDYNYPLNNATIHFKDAVVSGMCGDNLTWTFYNDGELKITGTGAMYDNHLWESYEEDIKSVVIGKSVTTIGINAFYDCDSLTSVAIPDSVTTIGSSAFSDCDSLTSIIVDADNQYYSSDSYGVLYNKDKTELIQYPIGNERTSFTIPDSVTTIGEDAFWGCSSLTSVTIGNSVTTIGDWAFDNCESLTSVTIPDSVTTIGVSAFEYCYSLTDVYYGGSEEQWSKISIGSYNEDLLNATIHFLSEPDTPTYTITYNANGGSNAPASQTKTENVSITLSKSTPTRSGYTFLGWSINKNATVAQYKPGATFSANTNTTLYAVWSKEEIYNLGEETYSFDNFGDSDSPGGHCFGMSMTSAGYYLNELDIKDIGLNSSSELYTASETAKVKKPICHYQDIQGDYSRNATVAGGMYYKYGHYNISSDWNAVVNYVKNHNYDDTGALQIGFRKSSQGGHAVNFLRYENVNGEDRIYAYDNNFPNTETYFYKGSDGKVYQKPESTFSGAIDCIALRSVEKYFDLAGDFDSSRVIYGWADTIEVEGITGYPMELGGSGEYMMYEIPDGVDEVVIVPLTDNATFEYMNEDYQFGEINDETYGIFTLSTSENASDEDFVIENEQSSVDEVFVYDLDMTYKSYAFIETEIYVTGNTNYTVEYSSSNPSVAYVDEFGEVYASGEGSADITVTVTDEYGNEVSDTCEVKVSYAWWQWIIIILLLGFIWY